MIAIALAALVGLYIPHDGDSGRLITDDGRSIKIRLAGLDAGETKPFTRCRAARRRPPPPAAGKLPIWACSPIARQFGPLATTRARQISQQGADCKPNGGRSYGRIVVRCRLPDGSDLGARLVSEGLAISEPKFGDQYHGEMEEARRRGLGVWAR